jgi:Uma2 family endonuclease
VWLVRSPGDSPGEVAAKVQDRLDHGCRLVVAIDTGSRTAVVHRCGTPPLLLTERDLLAGGDVVPGFTLAIADLFAP